MGGSNFAAGTFTVVALAVASWLAAVANVGEPRMWLYGPLAVGLTALAWMLLKRAKPEGPPV